MLSARSLAELPPTREDLTVRHWPLPPHHPPYTGKQMVRLEKMEGGGSKLNQHFSPPPPLPLPITHIMLKWMNKWMNEWMNEQTNECKNTKNTIHFPPPPVRGGELFPPAAHMYIYSKKNIQFEPKNSSEFFNATGIFPPCFGKKLIREHLTFKFQTI